MSEKHKSNSEYIKWLEKIQLESWQLELIISGLAIFGLIEAFQYLTSVQIDISNGVNSFNFIFKTTVLGILINGIIIFLLNLIFHVIIRGLWIGVIGLRYVSGDIEYEKLNFSSRFTKFYKRKVGHFDSYIERLEKLSSSLFSFTFLLIFIFISIFIWFLELSLIGLLDNKFGLGILSKILANIHILMGLLVGIDFLLFGIFKKIKARWFSFIYYYIFRYKSFITLSFIWRPIHLNFIDTKFTKRLFLLIVPYFVVITLVYNLKLQNTSFFPHSSSLTDVSSIGIKYKYDRRFYNDELENLSTNNYIPLFTIPSKRIDSEIMEVFVRIFSYDDDLVIEKNSELIPFNSKGLRMPSINSKAYVKENNIANVKDILKSNISIKIDDMIIQHEKIACDFYVHKFNKTSGLLCFFSLDSLQRGRHYLTVEKLNKAIGDDNKIDAIAYSIPFIYEN